MWIRIIKQKELREMRDDRNAEQHWEGNSVNTESPTFMFHMSLNSSLQRGKEEATDFINII